MTHFTRGQVGIGTLIVFIAMVLVAAIAAGVLIDTAGFLQSKSEQTGAASSRQVTDRVEVTSAIGRLDGTVLFRIDLNVKKAPGGDDIDLEEAVIHWVGPDETHELVYGTADNGDSTGDPPEFGVEAVRDDSGNVPVIDDGGDVLQISMPQDSGTGDPNELQPGESATVRIVTASGASTTVVLTAADNYDGKGALDL